MARFESAELASAVGSVAHGETAASGPALRLCRTNEPSTNFPTG